MTKEELLKIAKPILFNTEMVKAILEGRKTVTRRVVKQKDNRGIWEPVNNCRNHEYGASVPCYLHREKSVDDCSPNIVYPKIDVGDYLYVRETYYRTYHHQYGKNFYRADGAEIQMPTIYGDTVTYGKADGLKWKPSIHMPKEVARIFLKVTDVRVERLQDITPLQAKAEGIVCDCLEYVPYVTENICFKSYVGHFKEMWDSIVKNHDLARYGWEANPWVWVYEFERVENNG